MHLSGSGANWCRDRPAVEEAEEQGQASSRVESPPAWTLPRVSGLQDLQVGGVRVSSSDSKGLASASLCFFRQVT